MIGQTLGHYHVVAKIGEGGMGVVYRARDEVLHRDVAIKVVSKSTKLDQSASQNLLHEARASSALSHPNICTIHEVGETAGDLYIVMELVEGKSLASLIGDTGLPVESVLRYGVQIANALGRAHDRGIVHRDLKSANVVVTADGLVKVLDFGLATRTSGPVPEGPTRSFVTAPDSSSVSGTLPYIAPEVLRGEIADYRSDLWALGVVLYEAASGRMPFEGRTGFEISAAIMREMPKPLGAPVPPGLWAVIQRCLAKEPTQRYQRAGEVQAALEAVQSGAVISAEPGADRQRTENYRLAQSGTPSCQEGRFSFAGGNHKRGFRSALQPAACALGSWWAIFSWSCRLRVGLRRPGWPTPLVGFNSEFLGNTAAFQRRFREELDQSTRGAHSLSRRFRRFPEEHLADLVRTSRRTECALLRRGARGTV